MLQMFEPTQGETRARTRGRAHARGGGRPTSATSAGVVVRRWRGSERGVQLVGAPAAKHLRHICGRAWVMADVVLGSMTAPELVAAALRAGVEVRAEGDRLVVRGPRAAEGLGRALLGRKAEVLAVLAGPAAPSATALPGHDAN